MIDEKRVARIIEMCGDDDEYMEFVCKGIIFQAAEAERLSLADYFETLKGRPVSYSHLAKDFRK